MGAIFKTVTAPIHNLHALAFKTDKYIFILFYKVFLLLNKPSNIEQLKEKTQGIESANFRISETICC